jgi:signal transduction histidine kinase
MTEDQLVHARMRTLSTLSGATVHELRGAANSLALHLQLLSLEPDDEAARDRHRRSLALADAGRRRLFDMAEVFVRHTTLPDPSETTFDLARLAADSVALARPYAAHRGIDVTVVADASTPAVAGRREAVAQTMLELLVDLLQATPHGVALQLTVEPANGRVSVRFPAPPTAPDPATVDRHDATMRWAGGTARRLTDGGLTLELPAAPPDGAS